MHQEHDTHQCDDDTFLKQRAFQGFDGTVDQIGTVIDSLDTNAIRQAGSNLGDLGLDVADHLQRVLSIARHHNSGYHFAFAIQLGETAPLVRHQLDTCDVADQHRRAVFRLDHQILDVTHAAQVTPAAHHVLGFTHFQRASADIAIGLPDHVRHFIEGNAVSAQLHRIHCHLVLLHKAAD